MQNREHVEEMDTCNSPPDLTLDLRFLMSIIEIHLHKFHTRTLLATKYSFVSMVKYRAVKQLFYILTEHAAKCWYLNTR